MTEIPPSFARLNLDLKLEEPMELASYKGPMLRGALGTVFRSAVCVRRSLRACDPCTITDCPYRQVFESADPLGRQVPRPFVIEPPDDNRRIIAPGGRMQFGLVLFGRGLSLAPLFVMLFDEVGKVGLGRTGAKYSVASVSDEKGDIVYKAGDAFKRPAAKTMDDFAPPRHCHSACIRFLTPTVIRREGETMDAPSPEAILEAVIRRVKLLYRFHSTERLQQEAVARTVDTSALVRMTRVNVARSEVVRFSTRQQKQIRHAGFTGEVELAGDLALLYPWLKTAEYLHVGKGCTFGLGRLGVSGTGWCGKQTV